MKLAVVSFTRRGSRLCCRLVQGFRERGVECDGYMKRPFFQEALEGMGIHLLQDPVGKWTGEQFGQVDGLLYIGAAGIAVRAVAPYLADKMTDPAVAVADEAGDYVISLLSGHVGGANRLAKEAAGIIGATPVITTATDVNGITAIDRWAAKRGLTISDRVLAKQVAATLLEGRPVGIVSDFPLQGGVPKGYTWGKKGESNVWVTVRKQPEEGTLASRIFRDSGQVLRLIPRALTVGVGCRKGIGAGEVEYRVEQVFRDAGLERQAIAAMATIDLKAREEGLCRLADQWGAPLVTFSAEELEQVKAPVAESSFVRQVTGTGNVCERAALLGAGARGRLLVEKRAGGGVTVAVAVADYQVKEERGGF